MENILVSVTKEKASVSSWERKLQTPVPFPYSALRSWKSPVTYGKECTRGDLISLPLELSIMFLSRISIIVSRRNKMPFSTI